MASPTVFNAQSQQHGASSSGPGVAVNQQNGDVLILCITTMDASGYVTTASVAPSVAGRSTWNSTPFKRLQFRNGSGNFVDSEIWIGQALFTGSNLGLAITLSSSASVGSSAIEVDVAGAFSFANWNDPNVSLPATSTGATAPTTVTFSTSQADDLCFIFTSQNASFPSLSSPSGWTNASTVNGIFNVAMSGDYLSVSTIQTNRTALTGTSGSGESVSIVVVATADAAATNVNLVAATSSGAEGAFTPSVGVPLGAASATGAVSPFSFNLTQNIPLAAASATGVAAPFVAGPSVALHATSATGGVSNFSSFTLNVSLSGVSSSAVAGNFVVSPFASLFPVAAIAVALPFTPLISEPPVLPVYSIMSNRPVPSVGAMGKNAVPVTGTMANVVPVYSLMGRTAVPSQGTMKNTVVACQGAFI